MPECTSQSTLRFSIVIAVYNDWKPLNACLQSLARQSKKTEFEVIVVDDGSNEPIPEKISDWGSFFRLTSLRQSHAGISTARNQGIRISQGPALLFVDADCILRPDCLEILDSFINTHPDENYFQLRMVGDCSNTLGNSEELRFKAIQKHMLRPNGRIRYLNTAGFAIRRTRVDIDGGLFDPLALRAEDTLLLAHLIKQGQVPVFVSDALVQHTIPLSFAECFLKDILTAHLEASTYSRIASEGVKVRISNRERFKMVRSTWNISGEGGIGRWTWFVLAARHILRAFVRSVSQLISIAKRRAKEAPNVTALSGGVNG